MGDLPSTKYAHSEAETLLCVLFVSFFVSNCFLNY